MGERRTMRFDWRRSFLRDSKARFVIRVACGQLERRFCLKPTVPGSAGIRTAILMLYIKSASILLGEECANFPRDCANIKREESRKKPRCSYKRWMFPGRYLCSLSAEKKKRKTRESGDFCRSGAWLRGTVATATLKATRRKEPERWLPWPTASCISDNVQNSTNVPQGTSVKRGWMRRRVDGQEATFPWGVLLTSPPKDIVDRLVLETSTISSPSVNGKPITRRVSTRVSSRVCSRVRIRRKSSNSSRCYVSRGIIYRRSNNRGFDVSNEQLARTKAVLRMHSSRSPFGISIKDRRN